MQPQEVIIRRSNIGSGMVDETAGLGEQALGVHIERIDLLDQQAEEELEVTMNIQEKAEKYEDLIARVNAITNKENGTITVEAGSELEKLLLDAQENGVKISKASGDFTDTERGFLVENIRSKIKGLNMSNDVHFQKLTRFTNLKHEMYQLTRTCLKTLHDIKQKMAAGIHR